MTDSNDFSGPLARDVERVGIDGSQAGGGPLTIDLPPALVQTPTYELIRLHHKRSGAELWGRERFRRLCVAFNETEAEMGMRIGLPPSLTKRRLLQNSFSLTEGILLEMHWRFIQEVRTGTSLPGTALAPCTTRKSPPPKDSQPTG